MNDNKENKKNHKDKKRINDIVKSKIKGLGLDALFHQVDISQKDLPSPTAHQHKEAIPQEDLQFLQNIKREIPLVSQKTLFSKLSDYVEKLISKQPQNKIILDIGTSSIKIIQVKFEKEKTILQDVTIITIPHIVTTTAEKLNNFILENLKQLSINPIFKLSAICSIIPRSAVIVKFISLPTLQESEIKNMLEFEAEQHLPFPIADVELDYQIIAKVPPQTHLALIAIKKDVINAHLRLLKKANINPDSVEISSIALYNSVLETIKKDGVYVQAHIGATDTDINIIQNKQLKLCRSIHWGSRNLTLCLIKNLNISFDNAEKIKKENGIILTKETANQTQENISQFACVWADELSSEIKRTIESFQINIGTTKITQVRLSGGGSYLINLDEYLRNTLREKIILEKKTTWITVAKQAQKYDAFVQILNPLLGLINPAKVSESSELSESSNKSADLNFNLLPKKIKNTKQAKKNQNKRLIITGVSTVLIAVFFILPAWILGLRDGYIKSLDKKIIQTQQKVTAVQELKNKISTIEDYISQKNSCMEILRKLSILIPYDITVNNFSFEKNTSIILVGIAQSHSSVVSLSQSLNDSEDFKNAKIVYTRKRSDQTDQIIDFEIFCQLSGKPEN